MATVGRARLECGRSQVPDSIGLWLQCSVLASSVVERGFLIWSYYVHNVACSPRVWQIVGSRFDRVMVTVQRARLLECGRSWVPDSVGLWIQCSVFASSVVDRGFQIRSGYGYRIACSPRVWQIVGTRFDWVMITVQRARLECGRSWVPDSVGLCSQCSVLAQSVVDRGFRNRSGYGYNVACSPPVWQIGGSKIGQVMGTAQRARFECDRSWVPDSIGLWLQCNVLAPSVVDRGFQVRSGYGYTIACSPLLQQIVGSRFGRVMATLQRARLLECGRSWVPDSAGLWLQGSVLASSVVDRVFQGYGYSIACSPPRMWQNVGSRFDRVMGNVQRARLEYDRTWVPD